MPRLKSYLKWLDANVERAVIIVSYVMMASIIFIEVLRRMILGQQAAWSTQVPIYLFLFLTWFSAAYNAKVRSHLAFTGLRTRLSPRGQFVCHLVDYLCWMVLGVFVVAYSAEQVLINRENFSMVFGTEFMSWYFMLSTPLGWLLIAYRVTQNLFSDINRFRRGLPLNESGDFAGGDI